MLRISRGSPLIVNPTLLKLKTPTAVDYDMLVISHHPHEIRASNCGIH